MINEPNVIKIRELPEKDDFNQEDYLPVQDTDDTWRVKATVLNRYIDNTIKPLQQSVALQQQNVTELEEELIERDDKRTETIEYMKELMKIRYKTHSTSQKSYSDLNNDFRICNLAHITIDAPADETDLPIPTLYTALIHIHDYKIRTWDEINPDSFIPTEESSALIYLCFSMKKETFTFFDDIYAMMSIDAIDNGVDPSRFVICTNEDKTEAWIDWVCTADNRLIDYTLLSDNSTSFHDPVIICDLVRNPEFVTSHSTENRYYCISGYNHETGTGMQDIIHKYDHGFEMYYFKTHFDDHLAYKRPPSYAYPQNSTIDLLNTDKNPSTILTGPLNNNGGVWALVHDYQEIDNYINTNGNIETTYTNRIRKYKRNDSHNPLV